MKIRVTPRKIDKWYEPCEIGMMYDGSTEFYPVGFVHIINFWQGHTRENAAYILLEQGKSIIIELDIRTIELARNENPS